MTYIKLNKRRETMKNVLVLLFSLVMMVLLIACNGTDSDRISTGNNEQNSQQQEVNAPNPELSQTVDSSEDSGNEESGSLLDNQSAKILQFDSVEDVILNQNETYLQEYDADGNLLGQSLGDYCYFYNGKYFTDTRNFSVENVFSLTNALVTFFDETDFPVIDRENGDQLVLIVSDDINARVRWNEPIDSSYPVYRLTFEGYCVPIIWEGGQPEYFLFNSSYFNGMGYQVHEIGGINIYHETYHIYEPESQIREELFLNALTDLGLTAYISTNSEYASHRKYVIMGDSGDTVSFGEFSGTVYNEYIIPLDARLYSGVTDYELTPTRTKNGFLLYDLSQLEPGMYCFLNKMFEIK